MSFYSTNVFLSEDDGPQDAIVNSLIALNLEPNQNVATDAQGKLISQEVINYDVIEVNGLVMTGGTSNSIQLDVYTPAQINTLNSNLGDIEDKAVLAYNTDSKKIDIIKSGVIYRGQQDILACPVYDMRFSQTLTTGFTYFQKLYSPLTTLISHIRLFLVTKGSGPIKVAIYDIGSNFKIAETNTQPLSWTNGTFVTLPFASPTRFEVGRNYWIAVTQNNLVSIDWQMGHTTTNASGGGEVGFNTGEISYYVVSDYTAGFPNNIPTGIANQSRIWYQLYGSFDD